jgi:hypothetical protein
MTQPDTASATRRQSTYDPRLLGNGSVVPYVGSWSGEELLAHKLIQRPAGGIGYADEMSVDRDNWGVLWTRTVTRIGSGRPLFKALHPLRQRRAMARLLCQVCAQPADQTEQGHLWLLPEQPSYEADWPEDVPVTLPPVCVECARLSVRMCPALRTGYVAVRAMSWVSGVTGVRFQPSRVGLQVAPNQDDDVVYYVDPAVRWILAAQRARTLYKCTFVDLERLA